MLATLTSANTGQDTYHLGDNRRHYNRDVIKKETIAQKEAADWAYALYIGGEFGHFYSDLVQPGKGNCQSALQALGRITHSWQDLYAHAIRQDGKGGKENSTFPGWGAWSVGVTGDPEDRATFWPSSYSMLGGGEHPPVSEPVKKGGAEYRARYNAANAYVTRQYKTYLDYWWNLCGCYCK